MEEVSSGFSSTSPNDTTNELIHTFIKVSHSDDEVSNDGSGAELPVPYEDLIPQQEIKIDDDEQDTSSSSESSDEESSSGEEEEESSGENYSSENAEETTKKRKCTMTLRRRRGRPRKDPILPEDDTSVDYDRPKGTTKPYDSKFKLGVVKYAERHSNSLAAKRFDVNAKRVREWRKVRSKLEAEIAGVWTRRPRGSFTVEEKLKCIAFAEAHSVDEAKVLYNVDKRTVEKWRQKKAKLEAFAKEGQGDRKRRAGCGRKPKCTHIEDDLRDWLVALRFQGVAVNTKMILEKVRKLLMADPNSQNITAPTTQSWVQGFLKRQKLNGLLLGTTLGHEDPAQLLLQTGEEGEKSTCPANLAELSIEIPENPNKRNKRSITLDDKLKIIQRIQGGESQTSVAKSLGASNSTVQTIWSCRKRILKKMLDPNKKIKNVHWKKYTDIDSALVDWHEQSLARNVVVTGQDLVDRAVVLCEVFQKPDFKEQATEWTEKFCKRHNIKGLTIPSKDLHDLQQSCSVSNIACNLPKLPLPSNPPDSVSSHYHDDFTPDFDLSHFPGNNDIQMQQTVGQNPSSTQSGMSVNHSHYRQPADVVIPQPVPSVSLPIPVPQPKPTKPPVSTLDAIASLEVVRKWITSNCEKAEEDMLSNHLNALENAVLKKRVKEISRN